MMVEKIVKLQRLLARRAEKLEFLEEHVRQLIVETQRKSRWDEVFVIRHTWVERMIISCYRCRIIQMYALREETGALAPATADFNKVSGDLKTVAEGIILGGKYTKISFIGYPFCVPNPCCFSRFNSCILAFWISDWGKKFKSSWWTGQTVFSYRWFFLIIAFLRYLMHE